MTEEVFARFIDKVLVGDGCWEWTGAKTKQEGYGRMGTSSGGLSVAHRLSYEHFIGPISEGLTIDHLCRNRGCVNPRHLEPVTNRDNILRGYGPPGNNSRKTHCPRGHALTGDNLRLHRRGDGVWRQCRECHRVASNKYSRRVRAGGAK